MANRRQLYEYKGNRCAHCSLTVKEMVERYGTFNRMFEFNHVTPDNKASDYDNLIRREISSEQLDEVDKCILLCRVCHGILHAQSRSGTLRLTVRAGGKHTVQTFAGQIVTDYKANRDRFLTNERVLVIPYLVKEGDEEPQLYFGTELEREGVLVEKFRRLPTTKSLLVTAYKSARVWLRAEHIEGLHIRIEQDIRFPVVTAKLCGDSEDDAILWVRNGVALTKYGEVFHEGMLTTESTLIE